MRRLLVWGALIGCDGGEAVDTDTGGGTAARVDAILALTGDPVAGETAWQANCGSCHSNPAAFSGIPAGSQASLILNGTANMGPFDHLPDQQIADLIAFIQGS